MPKLKKRLQAKRLLLSTLQVNKNEQALLDTLDLFDEIKKIQHAQVARELLPH